MTPQQHIDELAQALGCHIVQADELPGMMYVERGYVEGPTIHNQIHYFTMLHELGHFALDHTQGRPPCRDRRRYFDIGVLRAEAQAWEWALDHVMFGPIEEATRRFMWDTCLGSYYQGALSANGYPSRLWNGDRHYVEFVYDAPDAYFGRIVRRIRGRVTGFTVPYPSRVKAPTQLDRFNAALAGVAIPP